MNRERRDERPSAMSGVRGMEVAGKFHTCPVTGQRPAERDSVGGAANGSPLLVPTSQPGSLQAHRGQSCLGHCSCNGTWKRGRPALRGSIAALPKKLLAKPSAQSAASRRRRKTALSVVSSLAVADWIYGARRSSFPIQFVEVRSLQHTFDLP